MIVWRINIKGFFSPFNIILLKYSWLLIYLHLVISLCPYPHAHLFVDIVLKSVLFFVFFCSRLLPLNSKAVNLKQLWKCNSRLLMLATKRSQLAQMRSPSIFVDMGAPIYTYIYLYPSISIIYFSSLYKMQVPQGRDFWLFILLLYP